MLPINGLDFLSHIHHTDIKKVLLTTVASEDTAVGAFNDGEIDAFISKSEQQLANKIFAVIQKLQFNLFAEQSLAVYQLYDNIIASKTFIQNKVFLGWFFEFITNHEIRELYLVTEFGMLDFIVIYYHQNHPKTGWLSLRDESDMFALLDLAQSHGTTEAVLTQLSKKAIIPTVTNLEDAECPPDHWLSLFQPAQHVDMGNETIYYTFLENVEKLPIQLG